MFRELIRDWKIPRFQKYQTKLHEIRERVDELEKNRPELSAYICNLHNNWTYYEAEIGEYKARSVYSEPGIAIAEGVAEAVTRLGPHTHHGCTEWIFLLEGELHLELEPGKRVVLQPGQSISFDGEIPHSAYFPKQSTLIVITVPAAEGFPE